MIQRKQSLWLLIAALLNSGVLFLDLYRWHEVVNGVDTEHQLRVTDHFPSLLIALTIIILPLVTIFMFQQRKTQIRLSIMSIIAVGSFVTMMLTRVSKLSQQPIVPTMPSYWVGAVLPVISLVFLVLAIFGIRRDDKLVKSMDRLR